MSDEIDETKCNLCKNAYTNPKLLHCFHVFCCECLHDTLDSQNNILSCKTCNEKFNMTNRDIDQLPIHMPYATITNIQKSIERITHDPNSILCTNCIHEDIGSVPSRANSYCIQCQAFFCDFDTNAHQRHESTHDMKSLEEIAYIPIYSQLPPNPVIYCKKHENLEIRVYCADCDVACCEFCVTIDHKNHKFNRVEDSQEILLSKIKDNFDIVKQMRSDVSNQLPRYTSELEYIAIHRQKTMNKMNDYFSNIQGMLENQRKQWEMKITEIYDIQHQIMSNIVESMDNFQRKINHAETHVASSLERFPPYYLFSLSNEINSRLVSIRNSTPKKDLKVQSIDFNIPSSELREIENKIASIGNISRITIPDFSKASEVSVPSKFGNDDMTVHCITQDENNINMLISEKTDANTSKSHQIHVIDSSLRKVGSVNHSMSIQDPAQMTKMASGNILVTDSLNRNVVILNNNETETSKLLEGEDNLAFFDPTSISVVKHGEEKDYVVVYDKSIGEINVLNEHLDIVRQIQVKEVEPRYKKSSSSSSSSSSAGSSRSSSRTGSRMSDVSSPDSTFSSGGSFPMRGGTYSPVCVGSAVKKLQQKPSQSLAINSKNQILVAHEDEPSYTTYSLSGTKLRNVNYKKHLQPREKITMLRTNSNKSNASTFNPSFRRTNSTNLVCSPLERSSSGRNSPKIGMKNRTLITTDKLDNIYLCRNKEILTFNAANNFLRKDKLPEDIDPVSFLINPFGEAYILSSNGQLHLFGIH